MKFLDNYFKYEIGTTISGLTQQLGVFYCLNIQKKYNRNVIILTSSLYEANKIYNIPLTNITPCDGPGNTVPPNKTLAPPNNIKPTQIHMTMVRKLAHFMPEVMFSLITSDTFNSFKFVVSKFSMFFVLNCFYKIVNRKITSLPVSRGTPSTA